VKTELSAERPAVALQPAPNAQTRRMFVDRCLTDEYKKLCAKQSLTSGDKKQGLKLIIILLPDDDATIFSNVKW
jgi:hypothetical protein